MLNWKGPWVKIRDGGCKCCGQLGRRNWHCVIFFSGQRTKLSAWLYFPGLEAGYWTTWLQEVSCLALSFLPQFSGLSELVSQSEGLYFKTELGLLLIFLVLWETCRKKLHFILGVLNGRDSGKNWAYSSQTDFQTYSIHGENMNDELVWGSLRFAGWGKQITDFP